VSDVAKLNRSVKVLTVLLACVVLLLAYVAWVKDWDLELRVRDLEEKQRIQVEFNKTALGVQ
jgi:hypothetical protein